MPFKSGKFWSSTFSKVLSGAALSAVALTPILSWASITITSETSGQTQLVNAANSNLYYPSFISKTGLDQGPAIAQLGVIDLANGFNFVDLGADSNPNGTFGPAGNPGVVYFNVISSNTTFANAVAIAVSVVDPSTTQTHFLPIASYQQSMCGGGFDGGNCCEQGGTCSFQSPRGSDFNSGIYYYGATYPATQTILIGLDPQAICRSLRADGSTTFPGCNNTFFSTSTTVTNPAVFALTFAIYNQTDLTALNDVPGPLTTLPAAQDTAPVQTLDFYILPSAIVASPVPSPLPSPTPTPTAVCNLTAPSIATPQDSSIQIDGSQFSVAGDLIGTAPGQIIAVANLGTSVDDQATGALAYTSGNSLATGYFTPGTLFVYGGFQDSTPTQTFDYKIGFLLRDYAGFVFDDHTGDGTGATLPSCAFPGEYSTSAIQGFLNQNKCFIATAAFRMGNDGPIRLLREFRDQFLEQFGLGRSFVGWYYGWSPDAADWLIDHPVFRFPVLLALIPLQLIAWTILHPIVLGLLAALTLGLSVSLLLGAALSRSRKSPRKSKEGTL
jgi:hypothetical protein